MPTSELRPRLILLAASILVSLLVLEAGVRLFTPFPITEDSNKTSHPKLGYVISSALPDIDESGFRNSGIELEDAQVAVIGDSHTYGNNVTSE